MTLAMPDSIYPVNLPPGYPAYLGYADGKWPTAGELKKKFPAAHIISLTVTGATLGADGCDIEPYDLTPVSGADWAARKLYASPGSMPVLYASVSVMPEVIAELGLRGVPRAHARLLSAHYGDGKHICGPTSCAWPGVPQMDGTQWTDSFTGLNGATIDMSEVLDSFFGTAPPPPAPTWEDTLLATIPTVKQGDSGQIVKNWQGLLMAHGYSLSPYGSDGHFGDLTDTRTRAYQGDHKLTVDGVVGQNTWTRALTG